MQEAEAAVNAGQGGNTQDTVAVAEKRGNVRKQSPRP